MADNTPASNGDSISTDDLATLNGGAVGAPVKVQRVKVGYGPDGDFRDVDATFGLPIASADIGAKADAAASSDTGTFSLIALFKRWLARLGQQNMAGSLPVVLATELTDAQPFTYSQAGVITLNTVILTIDCLKLRSLSIQCTSMGASGQVQMEFSNDNATWSASGSIYGVSAQVAGPNAITGAGLFIAPVCARYCRLKMSTATTSGTTTLSVQGFQNDIGPKFIVHNTTNGPNVNQGFPGSAANAWFARLSDGTNNTVVKAASTAAAATDPALVVAISPNNTAPVNINAINGLSVSNFSPSTTVGGNGAQTVSGFSGAQSAGSDVTSAARTTSGNSGTITDAAGGGIAAAIVVSAVSGTTPTLDIALQESYDGGTTWQDVYHCERLIAAGTLIVPPIALLGRRRWAWTISAGASFTFAIGPTRGATQPFPLFRQFFDRSAGLLSGTASATSASYQIAGCKAIHALITLGAATTPAAYAMDGSADGQNWVAISSNINAVAGATTLIPLNYTNSGTMAIRFVRVRVATGGAGQTGTVVSIGGIE